MNINKGKAILEKYPQTKSILSNIFNMISLNNKKIKGKNNYIKTNTAFLKKCKITIVGNNNKIILGDMCYLTNTKISIFGDNNEVILGNKVYVNSGDFYLED